MTQIAHRAPTRNHPRKWLHAASSSIGDSHEGDSRLHTVVDDRHHSYYAYDHAGERTLKVTGHSHQLDVNADLMHTAAGLDEFTLYPSPYLVFTNRGYTKHYYAGTERLAARLGGGFDRAILREQTDIAMTATHLFKQSQHHTNERHLNAPPAHTIRREGHLERVFRDIEIEFAIPEAVRAEVHLDPEGLIQAAQNIVSDNTEPEVYFYHSDHLGSASWITDATGTPVQHLQYLPYGEPFVNQRAAGYSERFTFTGKERDEETGYSYFGARFMDHELMTMWLSVDPLADKYPSISPYAYCAWNPLNSVDLNGDSITLSRQAWEILKYAFSSTFNGGLDNVPFSYNSESGKLLYAPKEGVEYSAEEQTIIDHFSSLSTNESYDVSVHVVDNDFYYHVNDGNENTLQGFVDEKSKNVALGVTLNSRDSKGVPSGARVYISSQPLDSKRGKITKRKYSKAYQALAIMHEIGGHAYCFSQRITGDANNTMTENFENMVRGMFRTNDRRETLEIIGESVE